jgi:glycine cleavage system H protein
LCGSELEATPEKLNSDPHKSAWLIRIKLADQTEVAKLMDAKAYEAFISEKNKEASA